MPAAGPSYPAGTYRFVDRVYMVITYETDADIIAAYLPEPLEPLQKAIVLYEWIKMPDSSGFGSYTASGKVIPCRFRGQAVKFVALIYLDGHPPIAPGREIWGFPKKYAHPKLEVVTGTLTGTFSYGGQLVAMGTMRYKHESMAGSGRAYDRDTLRVEICQFVAYSLIGIVVKGSRIERPAIYRQ
jgi:acetoacetate decarboxylase